MSGAVNDWHIYYNPWRYSASLSQPLHWMEVNG
jgi:hypothetical protein